MLVIRADNRPYWLQDPSTRRALTSMKNLDWMLYKKTHRIFILLHNGAESNILSASDTCIKLHMHFLLARGV